MPPSRKVERVRAGDVPSPIAAGVVVLLLALFVPMAWRRPARPTSLPALRHQPDAVMAELRRDLAQAPPAAGDEVLAAWTSLNAALARRDPRAAGELRERFARVLSTGTLGIEGYRRSLRARACAVMAAAPAGGEPPLRAIARRHGLLAPEAPPGVDASHAVAWCYIRWERLALPTPEEGQVEELTETFLRVPTPVARAFVSWGIGARCSDLVDRRGPSSRAEVPRRCATLRREFVGIAARMEQEYHRDEALAATDMMLGSALSLLSLEEDRPDGPGVDDALSRTRLRGEAELAFQHALERYSRLLQRAPSRRLERYALAATEELATD